MSKHKNDQNYTKKKMYKFIKFKIRKKEYMFYPF